MLILKFIYNALSSLKNTILTDNRKSVSTVKCQWIISAEFDAM